MQLDLLEILETHLTNGHDVDVVFCLLRMRHKRLNQELSQDTLYRLDLLRLASTSLNPGAGFRPGLVEGEQTALASSLDQLIGLCDELSTRRQQPRVGGLCLVEDALDVCILGEVQRGQLGRRVVRLRTGQRRWLDDGSSGEVVGDDGLCVALGDGFSRHVVYEACVVTRWFFKLS